MKMEKIRKEKEKRREKTEWDEIDTKENEIRVRKKGKWTMKRK